MDLHIRSDNALDRRGDRGKKEKSWWGKSVTLVLKQQLVKNWKIMNPSFVSMFYELYNIATWIMTVLLWSLIYVNQLA